MCDFGHEHPRDHHHFGFLVDTPAIRALIGETRRLTQEIHDPAARIDALKPAFTALLANDTACVWRHKFEPASGVVTAFRSGYTNAPCPPEKQGAAE